MNSTNYRQYLLSERWANMKLDLIQVRGAKCERCSKKSWKLHLHHLTYERLYNEEPEDLELLCGGCHAVDHGIFKPLPQKRKKKKRNRKAERELQQQMNSKAITVEDYVNQLRLLRL